MAIVDDFVVGLPLKPLRHTGSRQTPRLLVIHYSVTNTVADAVAALNRRGLSYHILIEKDGAAFQTRPFTKTALHPGLSNWKAASGVDLGSSVGKGSIGICLMNMGFGFDPGLPASMVGEGKLIYNPDDSTMQRWERYPAEQVESCKAIARDIIATYPIQEVVGHHDVAIMGKFDPGPLFDLDALNALVETPRSLGFPATVRSSDGVLNLRKGPSTSSVVLRELANGTTLHIRSIAYGKRSQCIDRAAASGRARYLTPWASVDIDGSNKHSGFVHMGSLSDTPLVAALAAKL